MFYPEDSLKRGGRFYLCWVADSWPLRFATITHRQLWSQDIRKICDDLLEVMTNESGRPAKRFSLRLSSQLLRGLVRLYQRKAIVLLGDLCMINATVIKNANRKWILQEPSNSEHVPRLKIPMIIQEEPEVEPRVEELIQRSSNVVANIEEITLKEPTMPENQLLINDGFGEMREETTDRSVEAMRAARLDLPTDLSHNLSHNVSHNMSHNLSHDRTGLAPHDRAMERITEHDISMFNKSIGMELVQVEDLLKEIPEIPDIPPPDMNAPRPMPMDTEVTSAIETLRNFNNEAKKRRAEEEIVLEELRPSEVKVSRKGRGLVVDAHCKLDAHQFRARLACADVHLRCQKRSGKINVERIDLYNRLVYSEDLDSTDDVVKIRVPVSAYFARPAQGGNGRRFEGSQVLFRMFVRNLALASPTPLAEREMEEAVTRQAVNTHSRSQLERIEEEIEETVPREMQVEMEKEMDFHITCGKEGGKDISLLPTQVLGTLSQRATMEVSEIGPAAKRHRSIGYVSFRESQQLLLEAIPVQEAEKENIPNESQRSVTAMLRVEGLADAEAKGSETPLGSLDRTAVSLGDSDWTTDSRRFIRDQWGTEGTMVKILNGVKAGSKPLNISTLVAKGPLIPGCTRIIVARCFTSVLKLKQHGFIKVQKDPESLEILDIELGPKFEEVK